MIETLIAMLWHLITALLGLVGSLVFYLVVLPGLLLALWLQWRILNRAGFSGWWAFSMLFPPLWIIGVWLFAFARWPMEEMATIEIIPPRRGPWR